MVSYAFWESPILRRKVLAFQVVRNPESRLIRPEYSILFPKYMLSVEYTSEIGERDVKARIN
jgi:hypothetical protein